MPTMEPSRVMPRINKMKRTKYGIVAVTQTACRKARVVRRSLAISGSNLSRTFDALPEREVDENEDGCKAHS